MHVKIILYYESSVLYNNSNFVKTRLQEGLSPEEKRYLEGKIKKVIVKRHPYETKIMIFSHHEKMCIIDRKQGFMGGIDLCYSRYDTKDHKLFDDEAYADGLGYFPGLDYSNVMIQDFDKKVVAEITAPPLTVKTKPRMPW